MYYNITTLCYRKLNWLSHIKVHTSCINSLINWNTSLSIWPWESMNAQSHSLSFSTYRQLSSFHTKNWGLSAANKPGWDFFFIGLSGRRNLFIFNGVTRITVRRRSRERERERCRPMRERGFLKFQPITWWWRGGGGEENMTRRNLEQTATMSDVDAKLGGVGHMGLIHQSWYRRRLTWHRYYHTVYHYSGEAPWHTSSSA